MYPPVSTCLTRPHDSRQCECHAIEADEIFGCHGQYVGVRIDEEEVMEADGPVGVARQVGVNEEVAEAGVPVTFGERAYGGCEGEVVMLG